MNKGQLAEAVSSRTSLSKSEAGKVVDAVFDTIAESVKERKKVAIAGFGTFEAKTRNAREGINPATKEKIQIPERTSAAFKPATALKDL